MQDIETLTYTEALALREELTSSQEYNARLLEIITRLKGEVTDTNAVRRQLLENDRAIEKRNARIKVLETENAQLKQELRNMRRAPKTYNDVLRELTAVRARLAKEEAQQVALRQALSLYELSAAVGGGGE
jgi:Tfp pilus assembly protein PilN